MTNWKTYKIKCINSNSEKVLFNLGWRWEAHVSFKDENKIGEEKLWTYIYCANTSPFNTWQEGDYIEIDNDKTRYKSAWDVFNDTSIVRKVSSSMTSTRDAMINASSVNATALAVTRDLADRVDRGERSNFQYEIEDNGVKHSWVYKRN